MLVRLLYASRPIPSLSAEDLLLIQQQSQLNNPGHGITGLLCCSAGIFLQVLEGSRPAVNHLYGRISADPRHLEPTLLVYEEIRERRFERWGMGMIDLARLNPALLLKYSETATLDPYSVSGPVSMLLIEELASRASVIS
jgi:hypothetical protein